MKKKTLMKIAWFGVLGCFLIGFHTTAAAQVETTINEYTEGANKIIIERTTWVKT